MRTAFTIIVVLALAAAPAAANPVPPRTHVRPLTSGTAALLADAVTHSVIVKGLVDDLGETDIVVYLLDCMDGDSETKASLTFLTSAGGIRYLRIRLDRWRVAPWEAIAWLGHELQHAMEIAQAPEVHDDASLARLYRRIGWRWGATGFESDLARATGRRITQELSGITGKTAVRGIRGTR